MADFSQDIIERARSFDRDAAPAKVRVHIFAKELGLQSRDVIAVLTDLGITGKRASSSVTAQERGRVLDVIAGDEEEPAAEQTPEPAEESASQTVDESVDKPTDESADELLPAFAASDDTLTEVVPPVTPPPQEPVVDIPIFMAPQEIAEAAAAESSEQDSAAEDDSSAERPNRRRRGRGRGRGGANGSGSTNDASGAAAEQPSVDDNTAQVNEPVAIKGSTRLEAQRRRRADRREQSRKRTTVSVAEFKARRESVERTMVVRERERTDHSGTVSQVGILEDGLLVEHFVTTDTQTSMIGNIYLGRVQNVLPSMEAAFINIGTDRNGVIYSADLDWRQFGANRSRRIENALKTGDQVLVQVTKDPLGHKGPRLTMHISMAGRYLVYVPGGKAAGISRKLPEPERRRLKEILKEVTPQGSGTIIRTAAEGVEQDAIAADIARLEKRWQEISKRAENEKNSKGAKPVTMYEEPDMVVRVVRDLFNEDFDKLIVEGKSAWRTVQNYVDEVAPDLSDRLERYDANKHKGVDVFSHYTIDEQIREALDRTVALPSGGSLVIDRTEAMTVIDVNTGKFTGSGGNLEETVTRNNLEAADEIVRQMRLRDLGGMIVVDFIDMVLPENKDLVLRRLNEALTRDRTRHEVSEVTSLGLVQMTRKRLGTGLLETFTTPCCECGGRGLIVHEDPVEQETQTPRNKRRRKVNDPAKHPAALALRAHADASDTTDDKLGAETETATETPAADETATQPETDKEYEVTAATSPSDGQRRGNRRNRRSRRRSGQPRPEQREQPEEQEQLEQAEETTTDLAAIAAAATDEARQKDPEEPSDDRYVSRSARRRHRRRVVRRTQQDHQKRQDTPKQAEPEKPDQTETSEDRDSADKATQPRQRRGRRRTGRRRVTTAQPKSTQKPKVKQVSAPGQQPAGQQPAGQQPAGQQPATSASVTQTYEEALAEFEANPRRKRPTRGRSRSDHAPKPEDFGVREKPQPKSVTPVAGPVDEKTADNAPVETMGAAPKQSPRRGRRRVVRKTTAARPRQPQRQDTEPKADKPTAGQTTHSQPATSAVRRRGRRRVVHKSAN